MPQYIEFQNDKVHIKSGTSGRTGKPYSIREQEAYLHGLGKYPVSVRVQLPDEQPPYPAGIYEAQTPLSVGRFESLQVNRHLSLVLVKKSAGGAG